MVYDEKGIVSFFKFEMEKLEDIDKIPSDDSELDNYHIDLSIVKLLKIINETSNQMIKYYILNKLFNFYIKVKDFSTTNKTINERDYWILIADTNSLSFPISYRWDAAFKSFNFPDGSTFGIKLDDDE